MQIHYKAINGNMVEHERTEDAEFIGALVCASSCTRRCKGCINKDIKKEPTLEIDHKEIIAEVLCNPLDEGIIFGGLEWSESPLELLALADDADKVGLKVMIYTGCTIHEFWYKIGKAVYDATPTDFAELTGVQDSEFFEIIGKLALDQAITKTYWIKVGDYQKDFPSPDNIQFGVKLASGNQKIYKIEGEKE
jgi:organic radical activating enzyme